MKKTMKKIDMKKVMELLASLKNRFADLTEDKNYMLSTFDFADPKEEWEYDCVCEDLSETEEAIDRLYDIIYSDDTIIVDDELYYTADEEWDIFFQDNEREPLGERVILPSPTVYTRSAERSEAPLVTQEDQEGGQFTTLFTL